MGPLGHSVASLAAVVGLPAFAAALVLWPAWRPGWRERLGGVRATRNGAFWVHAASLGETRAARGLLARLAERTEPLFLTHTRAAALEVDVGAPVLAALAGRALAPLDHPWCVARAFGRVAPRAIVLVETELWPVAIAEAARRGVPVGVVSASISQRSFARYRRLGRLARPSFERLDFVAARTEHDAEQFRSLGARPDRVSVTGDLKLDLVEPPPPLPGEIADSLGKTPLLVAGSTHEGEEAAVLRALLRCASQGVEARLAIAPRRPQRSAGVVRTIERAGLRVRLRSTWRSGPLEADEVCVIDRAGELPSWYAAATVAFVGGTIVPVGGHNLYEPVQSGAFVLHGPHTGAVEEAARLLADVAAAERVSSAVALEEAVVHWLSRPAKARERATRGARQLAEHRGSALRTLEWIDAAIARGASR